MPVRFPFLTSYDPEGSSEGTLDPLGLYQIADLLAVQLVPAVRERMQRVRFLTAMTVGSIVTEGLEDDLHQRDASPYLVWEWLVVEALVRDMGDNSDLWGVPGIQMARRAIGQHGYLDARSYLKTPRVFGFNGVYKRLAVHLGLVDVHLEPGPNARRLVHEWAKGLGLGGLEDAEPMIGCWKGAVRRSLTEKPPRTKPGWGKEAWAELANAFAPSTCQALEKRCLRELLLAEDARKVGALTAIWHLQEEFDADNFREEILHERLGKEEPSYLPLLDAIRVYEAFSRSLQDAFDVLRVEGAQMREQGLVVPDVARVADFALSTKGVHEKFEAAYQALGGVSSTKTSLQSLFGERFCAFSEPMSPADCALALCLHHEAVQRAKTAEGKRPWFDRLGPDRIFIRHDYRAPRGEIQPDRYVHEYRGWPIRRFYLDLS